MPYRHTVPPTLAVVDLGSNSFRLEIGRVEGDQIFRLDTWRETIRFGAGLDDRGQPDAPGAARRARAASRASASACADCIPRPCARWRPTRSASRRNAPTSCRRRRRRWASRSTSSAATRRRGSSTSASRTCCPRPPRRGWSSTSAAARPSSSSAAASSPSASSRSSSAASACRSGSSPTASCDAEAPSRRRRPHARAEIEAIARDFGREHWHESYASSGTALALAEILEENGLSAGGITPEGLARLREAHGRRATSTRLDLAGLKPERAPVLAGGFAIMSAAIAELASQRINPVGGALRLGVLYDLLGRTVDRDSRVVTVERFTERYHVDRDARAARGGAWRRRSTCEAAPRPHARDRAARRVGGAAARDRLHRVAHRLPQARRVHPRERRHARLLVGRAAAASRCSCSAAAAACRRSPPRSPTPTSPRRSSRCGSPCCSITRAVPIDAPRITLAVAATIRFGVAARWLAAHPLTAHLLDKERAEWAAAGYPMRARADAPAPATVPVPGLRPERAARGRGRAAPSRRDRGAA